MSINEQSIQEVLKAVVDANTGKDLVSSRSVKNIKVTGSDVSLDVELGYPAKSQIEGIRAAVITQIKTLPGVGNISANVHVQDGHACGAEGRQADPRREEHHRGGQRQGWRRQERPRRSTWRWPFRPKAPGSACWTPTSMARRCRRCWASPPSRPEIGTTARAWNRSTAHGLQAMSIGFLIDVEHADGLARPDGDPGPDPAADRDALAAIVDYLIIDMPPGTGDIQLTLAQHRTGDRRGDRHHAAGHRACSTPARASRCSRRSACRSSASSRT
jgi:ATP-binding protein involved in chromosome partitioning